MQQVSGRRVGRFDRQVVVVSDGHQPITKGERKLNLRGKYVDDDSDNKAAMKNTTAHGMQNSLTNQQANN